MFFNSHQQQKLKSFWAEFSWSLKQNFKLNFKENFKMTNKLKNKRGFSLVELMVVVAIMGTLASIAIPAFNEYRKSAKKASYRADLTSLHKSWLAFGVELDSFCERDTTPQFASIRSVGMGSLETSKLYGTNAEIAPQTGACSGTPMVCTNSRRRGQPCSMASDCNAPLIPAGNGPGKTNFIGFGAVACPNATTTASNSRITENQESASSQIAGEDDCDLAVSRYELGVVGHVSGTSWFAQSIDNTGILSLEDEGTEAAVDPQCAT